ncbi:MAG: FAD-dependent oxidoreductase [Anaerolineae bacterium]|nr:FAD-dependent oxidoreductase [Anaerolineae bacterium]
MTQKQLGAADTLLKNGEMKTFEIDDKKILLARVDDEYHALQATCTHYGAPLEKGLLKGDTIICPWHHACFRAVDGDLQEPPALSPLKAYPVSVADGQVTVDTTPIERTTPSPEDGDDSSTYVIVGGGSAGNMAAETLRRAGFGGKVVILSASSNLPVDRPNFSKDYLAGEAEPSWIPLHGEDWYANHGIDLRLNSPVKTINLDERQVQLNDGSVVYDRLLLATGGTPRQLSSVPGHDLGNIFTLRTWSDADHILKAVVSAKRIVIIGASFIGMEAAAHLAKYKKDDDVDITVVGQESVPFVAVLGKDVGQMFQETHEKNRIKFHLSTSVEEFKGESNYVTDVKLKDGTTLPADVVVVGIGVRPATDFLNNSGIELHPRENSVLVNEHLQTSDPNVYAAGDIARWQTDDQDTQRVEHWRVAEQHGMVAAYNMMGQTENINQHVPFFWTNQWDIQLRYVGHASDWDTTIFRGQPDEKDFIAFYVKDGKMLAAAGCNRDRDMDALELILRDRMPLSVEQMRDSAFDLAQYATQ